MSDDVDDDGEHVAELLLERLAFVEHELAATQNALADAVRGKKIGPPEQRQFRDQLWSCSSCHRALGTYDEKSDVMRIRHRDLFVYVTVGIGGSIETICRHCGERNRQAYVAPA